MQIHRIDPPRRFKASAVEIAHGANVALDADEQVTFVTAAGREYDVVRKSWGYYATPSLNGRLQAAGFRTALAANGAGKRYVLLVESDRLDEFHAYLAAEGMVVIAWLDSDDVAPTTSGFDTLPTP